MPKGQGLAVRNRARTENLYAEMKGKRVNFLTLIEPAKQRRRGAGLWRCRCDCGREILILTSLLTGNKQKSCGCQTKAILRAARTTHGMSSGAGRRGERVWRIWSSMRQRCENSWHKSFAYYGGRGIKVCDRWQTFENFFADMGHPPDGCQLDRIDNEGNYSPENCRWTTPKVQANNRRNNVLLNLNGITMTLAQWAEHTRIGHDTLWRRLEMGWTTRETLTRPLKIRKNNRVFA